MQLVQLSAPLDLSLIRDATCCRMHDLALAFWPRPFQNALSGDASLLRDISRPALSLSLSFWQWQWKTEIEGERGRMHQTREDWVRGSENRTKGERREEEREEGKEAPKGEGGKRIKKAGKERERRERRRRRERWFLTRRVVGRSALPTPSQEPSGLRRTLRYADNNQKDTLCGLEISEQG